MRTYMKKTVALFLEPRSPLAEHLKNSELFSVIAETDNGNEALAIVENSRPDAIVCDLVLKETDGLTLLEKLKNSPAKKIVYTAFDSDEIIRCARIRGALLYLVKPLSPEIVEARLKDVLFSENDAETSLNNVQTARREDGAELRISNVFLSAGIPPHIKGYGFLRTGVKLAMKNPEILGNITKELYPRIAENFDTSPSKVERAIRHAIEVAWNRGRIENLNSIFGVSFYMNGDKPTNGEFIALVADRLIQEQRMGKF